MSDIDVTLTRANFDELNWEDTIRDIPSQECRDFYRPLFHKSREHQDLMEFEAARVYLILGNIAALYLSTPPYEYPFSNQDMLPFLQQITDEEWEILNQITPSVQIAEMRARLADYLWVEQRAFPMAQLAISAYLESANKLKNAEWWTEPFERIERAKDIWLSVAGVRNRSVENVAQFIEDLLDELDAEDEGIFSAKLMQSLLETEQGNPAKYISLAEKGATNNPGNKCPCQRPNRARMYWQVKAGWHNFAGQVEEAREALINVAETHVEEAQGHLVCRPNSYSQAVWHLNFAIEAFRRIGEMQERTDEVIRLYREYQRLSWEHEERTTNTQTVDLSQLVQIAQQAVGGKSQREAIIALALHAQPQNIETFRTMINEMAEHNPFYFHIPMFMFGPDARVTGVQDSLIVGTNEKKKEALDAQIFRKATYFQDAVARGFIRPALQQILIEHRLHIRTVSELMLNNPFVPPNREYIFTRGIYAGFMGDFLTAISLLIPQIEHSLRYILDANGIRVIGLGNDGVQDFHTLEALLKHPKLEEILGEDTVYDLRGLLIERFGSNLRNELAHGLLDSSVFFTDRCIYLWWLTLRLCCIPIFLAENSGTTEREMSETDVDESVV